MKILYIDNHMLALEKSGGVLCQPNHTDDPSLEGQGKAWIKHHFQKPGNVFLHAVHRLDRPVSGIVLFARTDKALSRLNASMRGGFCRKIYTALIEGSLAHETGMLEHYLVKAPFGSRLAAHSRESGAKKCSLTYRCLQTFPYFSLIEIELLSGRYHQIRAQFSAIGHPLVGDSKYGSQDPLETLFLHHSTLSFPHPITGTTLLIASPYPSAWDTKIPRSTAHTLLNTRQDNPKLRLLTHLSEEKHDMKDLLDTHDEKK
jgi:23S rRNA pseudouridine1911/1915/1917 synthase